MATVVKATEHVHVETATAVVSSLGAAATAEFKTLESGIAQEAVSATDDGVSNMIHKVEGAVETVIEEVANGAKHVVETVKQHPELIAEGALAVAIGVASLVQPELIAGEVAILGKMAADSAKKTVTQIASDEGEKIVKAISKDLAEDAKAEAEKDKVQAEEKRKAEGGEVLSDEKAPEVVVPEGAAEVKPVTEKTIAIEIQKPAAKTEEGSKDSQTEKEAAPVELKITIGSDGEIKAVSKSAVQDTKPVQETAEEKIVAPVVTERLETPVVAKLEVPIPVIPESATAVTEKPLDLLNEIPAPTKPEESLPTEPQPTEIKEAAPIKAEQVPDSSLAVKEAPIPTTQEAVLAEVDILPSGAIPVVEKGPVKEEAKTTELSISKPVVENETVTESEALVKAAEVLTTNESVPVKPNAFTTKENAEPEILSVLGIIHSDAVAVQEAAQRPVEKDVSTSELAESFVEQLLHRSNSGEPVLPVENGDEKSISDPSPATVESILEEVQQPTPVPVVKAELKEQEPAVAPVESSAPKESSRPETLPVPAAVESEPASPSKPLQQDAPDAKPTSSETSQKPAEDKDSPNPSALSQAKELAASAIASSAVESGPNLVTAAASVTNITTTTTKTVEVPSSPGVQMVTVSQETLDNLHSKLDAMHEAIQLITKTLAAHLPAPPSTAPVAVKEVEPESTPIPVAQAIPATPEPIAPIVSESTNKDPESPIQIQQPMNGTADETTPIPTISSSPPETQPTIPKRPTHVKRGSVIGSIGKFLWPFGGSAPSPSKDAVVKVSTVEISSEEEVQRPRTKSSGKGAAPGPEVTKAVSTVEVTEVLATSVGA
ncbi:hypothetical protein BKA64DRAFT_127757 [Cadophora sp. MPI-SDFR-AT-0126]|nr:hypothetical protein BKA64DRAFT_127757 [Leotiomycetes sp. MPI-SDFR-AT-0126]